MHRFGVNRDTESTDDGPSNAPAEASSSSAAATAYPSSTSGSASADSPLAAAAQRARAIIRRPVAGSSRRPSVRIRRVPSSSSITQFQPSEADQGLHAIPEEGGRRRSSSEPQRPAWYSLPGAGDRLARTATAEPMPSVAEEPNRPRIYAPADLAAELAPHFQHHLTPHGAVEGAPHIQPHVSAYGDHLTPNPPPAQNAGRLRRASRNILGWRNNNNENDQDNDSASIGIGIGNSNEEYDSHMVDLLDVIDPEVSTLSTLTNVQNSLFIPDLGGFLNRRPTYNLTRRGTTSTYGGPRPPSARPPSADQTEKDEDGLERPRLTHTDTISSTLTDSRYAVMPHGERLYGWTDEEKDELNDLVRHMLHSRKEAFKRGMKGFGQYVRRPLGLFVTVYATLITLFGAAWVLFLIGWLSVGSKKEYVVNVIDNVLVALFAIMGDGLAPFRMVDTYHMIYIARYHRLTWKLRKKKKLPKLEDHNDLPTQHPQLDLEGAPDAPGDETIEDNAPWEVSVLRPDQEAKLRHHQQKFAKSHTFYKPHETETHHAFPLNLLIWIVVLLDCHSLLQIALGTCTWSIDYRVRPFALTTVILCCSITVNITGGVLISVGDHRTRKKDVIERMFRQELTSEAIKRVEKRKQKEAERNEELDGVQDHADTLNSQTTEPDGQPRRSSTGRFKKLLKRDSEKSVAPN